MKIIWFISLLYVSIASTLFGKKASEQFLPKIMKWLKDQDQKIDQSQAFLSLAQIIQQFDEELQDHESNQELLVEIQKKFLGICEQKSLYEHQLEEKIETYNSDELKHSSNYFKNMIKDKEKMVDQDNKEIDKLKKQTKDHSVIKAKLKDIQELLVEVDSGLQNVTSESLYKILEILESKAVVGFFQYQQQYEEITQFLQKVDKLFKSRNFAEDKFDIINEISIVKNVLEDMKLNILMKLQENYIEQYETMSFFENSKKTHSLAKDYFFNEHQQFLGQLILQWERFLKMQYEVSQDNEEFNTLCKELAQSDDLINQKYGLSLQSTKQSLKRLENEFLNHVI